MVLEDRDAVVDYRDVAVVSGLEKVLLNQSDEVECDARVRPIHRDDHVRVVIVTSSTFSRVKTIPSSLSSSEGGPLNDCNTRSLKRRAAGRVDSNRWTRFASFARPTRLFGA